VKPRDIVAALRPDVVAAYGTFLLLALFPSLVASEGTAGFRITLADLLSGHAAPVEAAGLGGSGTLLVLFTTATVVLPAIWKNRLAALAPVVPLLVTLYGLWPLYRQHQSEMEAIEALSEFGLDPEQLVRQVEAGSNGPLGHLSVAAWFLFGVVIFLAIRGVMRAMAAPASASSAS
jgi:hypothetical protein